jgi:hypothetical protein
MRRSGRRRATPTLTMSEALLSAGPQHNTSTAVLVVRPALLLVEVAARPYGGDSAWAHTSNVRPEWEVHCTAGAGRLFAVICIKMVVVPSVCVVAQVLCMVIHNLHAQLCRAQQFLKTHEHGTGTPASSGKVRSPVHTSLEIRQSTPNGLYSIM